MRILIAEDESTLLRYIKNLLSKAGYDVITAIDGDEAIQKVAKQHFDIIVLDVSMPHKDGFEVCQEIRAQGIKTPILFLTSFDGKDDVVHGLQLGGDDYLSKPFDKDELLARISALLRRMPEITNEMVSAGNWHINRTTTEVTYNDTAVNLSKKEYSLVLLLLLHPTKVFTREDLLHTVWGISPINTSNRIDACVKNIRKKTDKNSILTVAGQGYKV